MSDHPGPEFQPLDGATDYQWPTVDTTSEWRDTTLNDSEHQRLCEEIESFFSDRLGVPALLMPSGRAALSLLLQYHDVSRGDEVFAPHWSSHCLWDVISRTATPRSRLDDTVDVVVAVHKWGRVHTTPTDLDALVIEDSVDSLFTDDRTLFPNGGRYEVLSLPKLIGSYTGGIVLFAEEDDARDVRASITPDRDLGRRQSLLRHREIRGEETGYEHWTHCEHENRWLDGNALQNIEICLSLYERNVETVQDRLGWLTGHPTLGTRLDTHDTRLPPVATFVGDEPDETETVMCRHVNVTKRLGKPVYEPAYLVPLHFGVTQEFFEQTATRTADRLRE